MCNDISITEDSIEELEIRLEVLDDMRYEYRENPYRNRIDSRAYIYVTEREIEKVEDKLIKLKAIQAEKEIELRVQKRTKEIRDAENN